MIVVATQNELEIVKKMGFENEPIIITGVGGVNVIRALKNIPKDEKIINIGYVGSNNIKIGTPVFVTRCELYHENVKYSSKPFILKNLDGSKENICCYTSTDFVTKTKIKEPCVFDMELAFICSMFDNVFSVKVVSDNLSLKEYEKNVEGKDAD